MCTLLFLYRVHPVYPVVIAANRDEFYSRPAAPPQLLSERPRAIGPLDLQEQGSWMGVNERGVFIGLTNQRTYQLPDRSLRTRGEVVLKLLPAGSAGEAVALLERMDGRDYNPFNLLLGDAGALYLAYARSDRARIEIEPAPAGVHALTNDRLGSPEFPRAARAAQLAAPVAAQQWSRLVPALISVLSDHQLPPLSAIAEPPAGWIFTRDQLRQIQAVCIHGAVYGTCSSAIIALGESRVDHYLFASGPPCSSPFVEVTGLLDEG